MAEGKSFEGPHPGMGLLAVRDAALRAGDRQHCRSEGKEPLQPLSDPVAQTPFSLISARTLRSKRRNPLFSQTTCGAFHQSCLGPSPARTVKVEQILRHAHLSRKAGEDGAGEPAYLSPTMFLSCCQRTTLLLMQHNMTINKHLKPWGKK